jgi:ankyrin repeat protein
MTENQNSEHAQDGSSVSLSSLLLTAAKKGHSGAVRALLKSRADHSTQDCDGNTPLLLAVSSGDTQSVALLLRSGASINEINSFGEGDSFFLV